MVCPQEYPEDRAAGRRRSASRPSFPRLPIPVAAEILPVRANLPGPEPLGLPTCQAGNGTRGGEPLARLLEFDFELERRWTTQETTIRRTDTPLLRGL